MMLQSATSFRSADCEGIDNQAAASNRFRSNIEIVEKPRQMVVLVATIAGASYLVSLVAGLVCCLCWYVCVRLSCSET